MDAQQKLAFLLEDKHLDNDLKTIAAKVRDGKRIDREEGVLLYERGELGYLGVLANAIRERLHGDITYFNRNFHIEPTNLGSYDCKFGWYSRRIKDGLAVWDVSWEEMLNRVRWYKKGQVNEVPVV